MLRWPSLSAPYRVRCPPRHRHLCIAGFGEPQPLLFRWRPSPAPSFAPDTWRPTADRPWRKNREFLLPYPSEALVAEGKLGQHQLRNQDSGTDTKNWKHFHSGILTSGSVRCWTCLEKSLRQQRCSREPREQHRVVFSQLNCPALLICRSVQDCRLRAG